MRHLLFIAFLLLSSVSFSQTNTDNPDFNMGFEKYTPGQKLPDKWKQWGVDYILSGDSVEKFEGNNSLLIKSPAVGKSNAFGCAASSFPAVWDGKEIELKGYMKFKDVKEGFVGLMLRIDGQGKPLQFSNMQAAKLAGSADWKEYSIKLPYPNGAKVIHIGALLTGTGQLWVDNFEVLLDGKKLADAKYKEVANAEKDKEFDNGSRIMFDQLSKIQIKELAVLGQVWGFLKYHHPAIAGGNYNWDYELFRILPKFQAANDTKEKHAVLESWIASLGDFKARKEVDLNAGDIAAKPDLEWMKSSDLSKNLQAKLGAIKNAERTDEHYYIGATPNANPEFKNERVYEAMHYPDPGYRLLALYRYWNMIQYYFPYKNLIDGKWNDVLVEFIPAFLNASDQTQYKLAALQVIARVSDTHANIYNDAALNKYFGERNTAVSLSFVENKPVVTAYHDKNLGEKSGLKIGDVLEKINGRPVDTIVRESLPVTPASNYPTQLRDISSKLLRTNDSTIIVDFKRGQKPGQVMLVTYDQKTLRVANRYQKRDTCFKMIRSDISYLYPGSIKNSYLPKIVPEILKTKGLIIDLRCYPSDFLVYTFANDLLPAPNEFVKFSAASIGEPGLFKFLPPVRTGKVNGDYFKGTVVILINENTQSSAEYTTMAFRTAPKAKVIGSTTAAADGDVSAISLPGDIGTYISGLGVYYPDGKGTQRVGIVPDIEVKPTIKGISEGRDELVEKAIAIIDGK